MSVTIEQVLSNWRFAIDVGYSIRTETGESGACVGRDQGGFVDVFLDGSTTQERQRMRFKRDQLFPSWWPNEQFHTVIGRKQTEFKIVPDPEPCTFCPCEVKVKIYSSFRVCCCPCHWQNAMDLDAKLEAVRYFFGGELASKEQKEKRESTNR